MTEDVFNASIQENHNYLNENLTRRTLESIPSKYREEVEKRIIAKDMEVIESAN